MATLDLGNFGSFNLTPSSVTACMSPDHNPPQHITSQPGGYSWSCPECGYRFTVAVSSTLLGVPEGEQGVRLPPEGN